MIPVQPEVLISAPAVHTVQVRPASREDASSLLALIDAHADFEEMDRPTREARDRLLQDGFGSDRRFTAFLASLEGRDVGYAIVYEAYSSFLARPTLYLEDLYVAERARGAGFGSAMFERLVQEALERGCARMEWMVVDWNDHAIGFYESRGADRLSEWHSYRIEETQMRSLVSRRALVPAGT